MTGRIDLKVRTMTVAEIVARDDHGRPILGPPKSLAGVRTLAIPASLVKILKDHLAAAGLTERDTDQFVFSAPEGGPWAYSNFRRRIWLPAVTEAGLNGVTFHDLRRAAATALVLENVDLKTAQTRLGHSDPRLTLAVYVQATTEADRAAADAVSRRFAKALRSGPRDTRAMTAGKTRGSRGLNPG